jgi:proteic killer suppression protein
MVSQAKQVKRIIKAIFRPVPEKYGFLAIMPVALKDQTTEDIFDGMNSKEARKVYAQTGWRIAARKLDPLDSVQALEELTVPSGLDVFQGKAVPRSHIKTTGS